MNYIYDIVLNFNKEYYSFYEWNRKDNIISVNIGSQLISNQIFDDKALAIINDCISNNKSANFSFIASRS